MPNRSSTSWSTLSWTLTVWTLAFPVKSFTQDFYLILPQDPPPDEVRNLFNNNNNDDDDDDDAGVNLGAGNVPDSIHRAVAQGPVNNTRPSFTYTGSLNLLESSVDFVTTFGPFDSVRVLSSTSFKLFETLEPSVCFQVPHSLAAWSICKSLIWSDAVDSNCNEVTLYTVDNNHKLEMHRRDYCELNITF